MDKYIGKRLDGRYEIKELIGYGGMAIVYKAFDTIEDKVVAIKILKEEFLDNQDFIRRFKNESKAIAVLSHKNIVKVFDVSFGDLIQYIVMEYIDGITLKDYIKQQQKISWQDAVHFTTQILLALNHAHEKGIIHRDIKPQNIMLLQDGTIKVTDFGIARFSRTDTRTMTDKAIGSVHYISPEQARGDITDKKADIYSVGVMLYEMLTGKLPFEADNAVSVAIMQMQSNPKPPREIDESIPEGLEDITLKAMQKDPMNRYLSAKVMLEAIEKFKENPSIRFEYKYLSDDSPTKYVEAIKSKRLENNYGDNYDVSDNSDGLQSSNNMSSKTKSKHLKNIIWVGVGVVVFAIMIGVYAISGLFKSDNKDVDVPNFIGLKWDNVRVNPSYKFNFKIVSVYDSNEAEGVIIDQDPRAGTKRIKEKSTIILKVNSQETSIIVPSIKGLTEEKAIKKLNEAGLKYEVMYVENSETAAGIVFESNPKEGSSTFASTPVKLFVSKGPAEKKVAVPNVIGKSIDNAINELISKGLQASRDNIKYQESEQQKDIVISTDPVPNTEVDEGKEIVLIVSSGPKENKSVEIKVDMPSFVKRKVSMVVLENNIVNTQYTKDIIPSEVTSGVYRITVKGKSGKEKVSVKLDGKLYRSYEVDFDSGTYTNTGSYDFQDSQSSSSSGQSSGSSNSYSDKTSSSLLDSSDQSNNKETKSNISESVVLHA